MKPLSKNKTEKNSKKSTQSIISISKIQQFKGNKALKLWVQYLKLLKQKNQMTSTQLIEIYEKCTDHLHQFEELNSNIKYLRIWIEYANFYPDSTDIFQFLQQKKIGLKHSLFYIAFATVLENKKEFQKAYDIYQEGFTHYATPKERLEIRFQEFLKRVIFLYQQNPQLINPDPLHPLSQFLSSQPKKIEQEKPLDLNPKSNSNFSLILTPNFTSKPKNDSISSQKDIVLGSSKTQQKILNEKPFYDSSLLIYNNEEMSFEEARALNHKYKKEEKITVVKEVPSQKVEHSENISEQQNPSQNVDIFSTTFNFDEIPENTTLQFGFLQHISRKLTFGNFEQDEQTTQEQSVPQDSMQTTISDPNHSQYKSSHKEATPKHNPIQTSTPSPTINTKIAANDIMSMFQDPLEIDDSLKKDPNQEEISLNLVPQNQFQKQSTNFTIFCDPNTSKNPPSKKSSAKNKNLKNHHSKGSVKNSKKRLADQQNSKIRRKNTNKLKEISIKKNQINKNQVKKKTKKSSLKKKPLSTIQQYDLNDENGIYNENKIAPKKIFNRDVLQTILNN